MFNEDEYKDENPLVLQSFSTLFPKNTYSRMNKFKFASKSSDNCLMAFCSECRRSNSTDIIDTWAPVSHNMSNAQSLSKHFTMHFLPTRPMTLACSLGVKWLTQAGSMNSLHLLLLASDR